MKDKLVLPIEEQLNRFLQPKCLIPGGLGCGKYISVKICTAWGRKLVVKFDLNISYFPPIMVVIWKAM